MPAYLDDIDVAFGWNGDFDIQAGDIKTTTSDGLQSLIDQIHSICASSLGDWEIYPNRGAGIDDFIGEPNTRDIADRLVERITLSIVSAELVASEDLDVRVVPVHIHKVLVIIRVYVLPTAYNQVNPGQVLQTSLVFDTTEQQVFFLDKVPQHTGV